MKVPSLIQCKVTKYWMRGENEKCATLVVNRVVLRKKSCRVLSANSVEVS
jgi:hypothetical protein